MPLPAPSSVPHYRYDLKVEIPATDAAVLLDALEDEPFGLKARLGEAELRRQIRALDLSVQANTEEQWSDFEADINVLSVYLSQYIIGREIFVQPTEGAPRLEGWKVIGRRGETARLKLDLSWDPADKSVIDGDEDVKDVVRRWPELPEWVRSAMRAKHPTLRAL